jgi:osmoprotectant transport system ATP-binding protein
MQKEFRALQQKMQKAVVFVTHDLREALLLADRIALMEEGRLIVNLPVEEFPESQHPLVRAYIEAFSGSTQAGSTDAESPPAAATETGITHTRPPQ